jgi:hypothetical protein
MRRVLVTAIIGLLLAACGGAKAEPTTPPVSNDDVVASAVAGTMTASQGAATATPDNTVATVNADALNTSFETALPLDGKVKASVKESTFYYSLNVPIGGVVTSTVTVDKNSPRGVNVNLFNADRGYLRQAEVKPGQSASLGYVFGAPAGGLVYWAIDGNAQFTLEGSAAAQDDAGSGGDAAPDGEYDTATPAKLGQISGVVGDEDRGDLYVVELPKKGGRLTFAVAKAANTFEIQTFDDSRNYMDNGRVERGDTLSQARLIPVGAGGRWYVRVNGEGEYAFDLSFTPQDDAKSGADAPDSDGWESAQLIKAGELAGEVGGDDLYDLYAIDLPKTGGVLTVTLQSDKGELELQTFDNDQNYMDDGSFNGGEPLVLARRLPLDKGGRWFIRVRGQGEYTLNLAFAAQDDGGSGKDAPDTSDFARSLPISSPSFGGAIGGDDREDLFLVSGATGRNVKVIFVGGQGTLDVQIFDNDRNYGPTAQANSVGEEASATVEGDQDYYIRISGDAIAYRIEITP